MNLICKAKQIKAAKRYTYKNQYWKEKKIGKKQVIEFAYILAMNWYASPE